MRPWPRCGALLQQSHGGCGRHPACHQAGRSQGRGAFHQRGQRSRTRTGAVVPARLTPAEDRLDAYRGFADIDHFAAVATLDQIADKRYQPRHPAVRRRSRSRGTSRSMSWTLSSDGEPPPALPTPPSLTFSRCSEARCQHDSQLGQVATGGGSPSVTSSETSTRQSMISEVAGIDRDHRDGALGPG